MAEEEDTSPPPSQPQAIEPPVVSDRWKDIWQLPALLAGVAMLALGLLLILTPEPAKNDYTGALDDVARAIHLQEYDKAQARLDHIRDHLNDATQPELARYELLNGDLVAAQILVSPYEYGSPENHQRVVAYYEKAHELGATFGPARLKRWVLTLISLDRQDEALAMLDRFKDQDRDHRYVLLRQMIERKQASATHDVAGLAMLLEKFHTMLRLEPDAALRRPHEIWAAGIEAQMLLDDGQIQRSIDHLLRQMAQFRAAGDDAQLAPLMIQLAQAYEQASEQDKAALWYRQAGAVLANRPQSPLQARVLVGLGRTTLAQGGDVREALDLFSQAESGYPQSPVWFDAMLGKAHCEATLGSHEQALTHFAIAIDELARQPRPSPAKVAAATGYLREHQQLNMDKGDYKRALDYLSLLQPLYPQEMPKALLGEFAMLHLKIAEQLMAQAQRIEKASPTDGPDAPAAIDQRKLAFQQAALHFGTSADYHYQQAQQVSATDDEAYGNALWAAATLYDRAQMWKRAIEVYALFLKTRSQDPLQLRAKHQLGLAYLADGQYELAARLLAELVSQHPRSPEAYISLVPLARAYSRMNKPDDALRVLRHVVTDHPTITRESEEYRLALIDLGKLLYHQGHHTQAIPYLAEALERYSDSQQGPGLRFRLADAYRQSIPQINRQLDQPMNSAQRSALEQEKRDRLSKAQVLYSQVVSELEARDENTLDPLEKLFHRNAYFYRADCAYDLGHFEQAISLYDLAAKRWDKDPSSLVALVQIVNANCELNRVQAARVANMRARERLKQIPEEAFDDVTIPMTRKHWEDWLRWSSQLDLFGSQASNR